MTNINTMNQTDKMRIKYGFWVIIIGFILVTIVFIAAIVKWSEASDVTAVVGAFTGLVGTVVGAFFGVQIGSAGKEKAERERKEAEEKALRMASLLSPKDAKSILE
ncbi:MAG: hypothetical protein E3J23_02360 [Candidatus Stahlbacteria bacterium]|nr:MAG: hypothetical protein E3J23_02360 [Candidatus Stahlbacteria bacterium]